jgi:ssRNA-specific RNase YbeY (16S rRNA maturation enzyme)
LFDYDHMNNKDARKMEDLEIIICGKLGFSDPYK